MKYLITHLDRVISLLMEHMILTFLSMVIAIIFAIPVGIIASKNMKIKSITMGILGIIYTIPGLALLSFLVPWFGVGFKSVLIALIAYSQMILVRNIITAITTIKPEIIEAGLGMGMSRWQVVMKVEFPLALPVIIAGIRIATISIVSLASIAAFINGGGLGELVLEGIRTDNSGKIIAGTIAIGFFIFLIDMVFKLIDYWIKLRPRT